MANEDLSTTTPAPPAADTPPPPAAPAADTPPPTEGEAEPTTPDEAQNLFNEIASAAEAADKPQRRTLTARRKGSAPQHEDGPQDEPSATPAPTPSPSPAPGATPAPSPAPVALKPNIPTPAPPPQGQFTAEEMEGLRNLPNLVKVLGGRLSIVQSALDKGNSAATAAGAEKPTEQQVAAAGKDMGKWDKLKSDFPEWAEGFEQFITARMPAAPAPATTDATVMQRLAAAETKADAATTELAIVVRHGVKWRDTCKTPEFVGWYNAQSEAERTRIFGMKSAADVNGVLDSFHKAHPQSTSSVPAPPAAAARGPAPADPELAAAVTHRGARSVPKQTVDDMTEQQQWDHFAREADNAT